MNVCPVYCEWDSFPWTKLENTTESARLYQIVQNVPQWNYQAACCKRVFSLNYRNV